MTGAEPSTDRTAAAADYLAMLGRRVRSLRARRGITRKMLSEASGISERYLAQLERGHGNISVLLLRQVAAAMSIPVEELVREGGDRPVEVALTLELLERLPPATQKAIYEMVRGHHGVPRGKEGRIALIGLRGAGKTTLGRRLAECFDVPFIRLAAEIERLAGMRLDEVFSLSGQSAYRRMELRALRQVIEERPRAVIEAGGGLVAEPATFNLLLGASFTVWVRATPEEHMSRVVAQGDLRPMADNAEAMADLKLILAEREAFYRKADAQLDTSGRTVEESLDELIRLCSPHLAGRAALTG